MLLIGGCSVVLRADARLFEPVRKQKRWRWVRSAKHFAQPSALLFPAPVFLGYQAVAFAPPHFRLIFVESRRNPAFVSLTDFRVYLLF